MSPADRVQELRRPIRHHDERYYLHNEPEITDSEFDALMNELRAIEAANPALVTPESPTQRVGGRVAEGFETVDGFKTRTPFETQLDMQASYAINAGGKRLTLLADVFNLFNIRRVTDYNAAVEYPSFGVDNPDFGTPTSANVAGQQYQRPFTLRLGARFAF